MNISLIQLTSKNNVKNNIEKAFTFIEEAIKSNPDIIALPESFSYMTKEGKKPEVNSSLYNDIIAKLGELAKKGNTYIIGGTVLEPSNNKDKFYNTCPVFNRDGNIVAKYRKIHLFDITLEESELKESRFIDKGKDISVFDFDNKMCCGLSICYDLRFPELYRKLVDKGVKLIFVPSAFTMKTGKDHWETLLKARAIENQVYIIAPAQFGIHQQGRESYGHSMIVDPWGLVIARKGEGEGIINFNIDINYVDTVRNRVPSLANREIK